MTDEQQFTPAQQPEPETRPRRKRWPRVLLRLCGTLLLIGLSMVVSIALAMAWLSSEDGRAFVVAEANHLLSTNDMTVKLGPITRLGIRHLDIAQISVSDKDGPAIEVSELSLTFDPSALIAGHIRVNELKTTAVTFDHAPDTGRAEATPAPAAEPFVLPALTIDKFALNNIHVTTIGPAEEAAFNAAGRLRLHPILSKSALSVDITSAADDAEILHLRTEPAGDDGALEITAHAADDGTGLLATITGLPHINVDISGAGPATSWQGKAKIDMGAAYSADGALAVSMDESAATLTLTGQSTAGGVTTIGKHNLKWDSRTGRTALTFTGKASQGDIVVPELAIEGTLNPAVSGGMDVQLTALARKVEPYLDDEAALAVNARIRGNTITVDNSYLRARDERVNLKGEIDTAKQTLSFDITSRIASLGRLDTRFGGAAKAAVNIAGSYANGPQITAQGSLGTQNLMTPWEQATIMLGMEPALTFKVGLNNTRGKIEHVTLSGADGKSVKIFGWFEGGKASLDISGGLADYTIATGLIAGPGHVETDNLQLTGPFGTIDATLAHDSERAATEGSLTWRSSFENTLSASFQKASDQLVFNGNIEGKSVRDYRFDFAGEAAIAETITATLQKLDGTFGGNTLGLAGPVTLRIEDDGTHLDPAVLKLNDGRIKLQGDFGKESFSTNINADALPANMGIFPLLFDGTINGDVTLSGPYTDPAGTAKLQLRKISLPAQEKDETRYVEGDLTVTLGKERADFTTKLSGTAGLRFNADGYLPVSFAPPGIPADKTLHTTLDASVDLRALTLLLGLDEHRLGGTATLDLALDGTLDVPQVTGTGGLAEGRYDNLVSGTALRDIAAKFTAQNGLLSLTQLSGKDKNGGSFTGTGEISFKTLRDPAYSVDLAAQNLNLISLDKLGLTISGDLHTQGDAQEAAVTGKVNIDNAEYYVTKSIGGDALSDFEVIETGEGLSVQTAEAPPPPSGPEVSLDIDLNADHGIYVRGPDLESEWGAKLHLGGTAAAPALQGAINLLRGQYRLLDTTLMMKKGVIGFSPPDIKDPDIDLTAELKGHGETAIIGVTGSAAAPAVELSSESGLKDDELLAQVLFGKSLNELTPVQALRIARLMAYLSGRGGNGFDPLAIIRRAIGIDALSVGMDEEGGATLSVGKYVSDKIYISIDQGASPESSAVRAEIEVTDEIEVETKASGASETSVGINWKRDY